MYRRSALAIEVLLVHPGGPFWAKKDLGAWSIPKGELNDAEDSLACAVREFPEVDRAEWFSLADARRKLNPGQVPLLDALSNALDRNPG